MFKNFVQLAALKFSYKFSLLSHSLFGQPWKFFMFLPMCRKLICVYAQVEFLKASSVLQQWSWIDKYLPLSVRKPYIPWSMKHTNISCWGAGITIHHVFYSIIVLHIASAALHGACQSLNSQTVHYTRLIHWPLFVFGNERGQCIGLALY